MHREQLSSLDLNNFLPNHHLNRNTAFTDYYHATCIEAGLYTAWTLATIYISGLGLAFMLRYRQGKWKKILVIEAQPVVADVRGRGATVVE